MFNRKWLAGFFALSSLGSVTSANAFVLGASNFDTRNVLTVNGTINLTNIDSGWYRDDFTHTASNKNYIAGVCANCVAAGSSTNDYFVFDISTLTAPVTSASFSVYTYIADETLTFTLHDYAGDISSLKSDNTGATAAAIYNDLGDGAVYGQGVIGPSNDNSLMSFTLTGAALVDLNTAIRNGQTEFAMGGTTSAVPEPQSLLLSLIGLTGMGVVLQKRRRT
ncbi:MAG: PEP-CTERM sorting domain-containing protein [Aquabacterium sp.]|uniref:PEP-CTERM sorting domain-containing protein n=1 Tax=Aquabacterium sp. TaxID=1872578 RepID=UPI0025BE8D87|nr:PEP-CTERM sorting domain-containing protein [Aquabacterium sp.]MBI3382610.1 PEP-CTERM sorting domain-containing protein [Aquabacterium sp.]